MSGNTLDIATEGLLQTAEAAAAAQIIVQQNHTCVVAENTSVNAVISSSPTTVCAVVVDREIVDITQPSRVVEIPSACPPRVLEVVAAGPKGDKGAPGSTIPRIAFSYGDAAGVVWTATDAGLLTYVRVIIATQFNGGGPTISVGTLAQPEAAMPASFNDPSAQQEFENTPDIHLDAGDSIYITISPGVGATQGSGFLLLEFLPD